jgi:hypothetical protein
MRKILYEEEQSLKDNRWLYVCMLTLTLAALLNLTHGIYWQVMKGIPWGQKPMSNAGIIAFTAGVFLIGCLVTWLLVSIKLNVIIDTDGVHYRFFPDSSRWLTIGKEEIIDFDVQKNNIFFRFGHHAHWFAKDKTVNVNGDFHLSLFLRNGKKIRLGSKNPEGLKWAMRRLVPKNELT